MSFSFAHLMTGGRKAEAGDKDETSETDEDDKAMEDGEDTSAEADDADDQAEGDGAPDEGDDDKAMDGDDDDAEDGGDQAAFARGRAAERKRIGAILSGDGVTASTFGLAAELAINSDIGPKAAAAAIKAAPQGDSGGLGRRMGADPSLSAGGGGGASKGPSAAALMAAKFGKGKK